jgi:hypothetical protein
MNRQEVLRNLAGSDQTPRTLVAENQSVRDIIKLIKIKHEKTAEDYDRISDFFWMGNVYDTCEALWNFCKTNIPYKIESEAVQTITSPAKILTRPGDCKHYSLFIAGVCDSLTRKGHPIDYVYRFASYNPFDDTPGHVFVVVFLDDEEIWIDPVLSSFNYHKDFSYAIDKKITANKIAKVSGITIPNNRPYGHPGLSQIRGFQVLQGSSIGVTGQQAGQTIMKLAPALSAVPVAALIVEGVGVALDLFGSKYTTSTQVRWLTCYYERMVKSENCRSDNTVNAADTVPAQTWFSYVLGVPIYDQLRMHALKGTDPNTGASLNQSYQTRVNNFLAYPDVQQAGVTYNQALEAAYISDTMSWTAPLGGWANMTAAPALIDGQIATASSGGFLSSFQNWLSTLPSWALPVGIVAILLLLSSGSHKKKKK